MARVWTVEITGGEDVAPGLYGVYTSRRKGIAAARTWARLPVRSQAFNWKHHPRQSLACLATDEDGTELSDPYFITVQQWTAQ